MSLAAALAPFDTPALEALANAGLVRRAQKDVAEGKVALSAMDGMAATLDVDGNMVAMDQRGPRHATCSCTSPTLCRHRLAAVIFLQGLPADATGDTAQAPTAEPAPVDHATAIAALDIAALQRWAGKAAWRAVADLLPAQSVAEEGSAVVVRFDGLDTPVRILAGQHFDGILSKAPKAQAKAWHAAAVLAARAHFGLELPPETPEDQARPEGEPAALDPRFAAAVAAALAEVVTLGFTLAPVPLEESLFELSVSSRADALPRLSSLLRGMAAQIRLRRRRALEFDPDLLLELAATAHALLAALGVEQGERRMALAGKVRRDFAPAPPLHLIGCGGERWRSTTGARGVTAWFMESGTGRWLSTTLARGPGQDPQFTPAEAWRTHVMWGAEPLATLAHARFTLEGANISADGRLSAPAGAQARMVQKNAALAPDLPGAVQDWATLRPAFLSQTGLGLDSAGGAAACLLAPAATAPPMFDDLAQQLVWPLRDEAGRWLALVLDHEEPVNPAIPALEQAVRGGWNGLVLATMRRRGNRLELTPVTLLPADGNTVATAPIDLSLWQLPWHVQQQKTGLTWLDRLRQRHLNLVPAPAGMTERALSALWQELRDMAESGGLRQGRLPAHAERIDRLGLPTLARTLPHTDAPAATLLSAAWATLLTRQQRCTPPLLV